MERRTPVLHNLPHYLFVFISYNFSFLPLLTPFQLNWHFCCSWIHQVCSYLRAFAQAVSSCLELLSSDIWMAWLPRFLVVLPWLEDMPFSRRSLPCLELPSLSPCRHALSSSLLYVFFFSTSIIWHFMYVFIVYFTPLEQRLSNYSMWVKFSWACVFTGQHCKLWRPSQSTHLHPSPQPLGTASLSHLPGSQDPLVAISVLWATARHWLVESQSRRQRLSQQPPL